MARIFFTELAYLQLLLEVKKYTYVETGAILVGRIVNGDFYVFESLDSGMNCRRSSAIFYRDNPYSEHLVDVVRAKYEAAVAIGFWHRHPGNFNRFSYDDEEANIDMVRVLGKDIISGLVNICNGAVHTRFWHISLDNKYEEIKIIVDDAPFRGVLNLKSINEVESKIVLNELGMHNRPMYYSPQACSNAVQIESNDSGVTAKRKRKNGVIATIAKLFGGCNNEEDLSEDNNLQIYSSNVGETKFQSNDDFASKILTIISHDIEKLSTEYNIYCEKYRNPSADDAFKDKLFLHFTNAINHNECDVVLYFEKSDLLFYVANKPIMFKNGVLAKYLYCFLGDNHGNQDV